MSLLSREMPTDAYLGKHKGTCQRAVSDESRGRPPGRSIDQPVGQVLNPWSQSHTGEYLQNIYTLTRALSLLTVGFHNRPLINQLQHNNACRAPACDCGVCHPVCTSPLSARSLPATWLYITIKAGRPRCLLACPMPLTAHHGAR